MKGSYYTQNNIAQIRMHTQPLPLGVPSHLNPDLLHSRHRVEMHPGHPIMVQDDRS
jgi:hypothetical protein